MEFLKAIRANDYKKVEKKLKKGWNVNHPIEENSKDLLCVTIPLCVAAARGFADIAELLMSYGANIHDSNTDWSSPLHTATYHGHLDVIRLLIARRVNVNNQDQHGDTALHIAVKKANFEAVVLLLRTNAEIEMKNNTGDTPYDIAMSQNFTRIAQTLTQRKMEIQKQKQLDNPKPIPPKPKKPPRVGKDPEESEKDRLKRQLQELELKEVNESIKTKNEQILKVTDEMRDFEGEVTQVKGKISALDKKLKQLNETLIAKATYKKTLQQDLESLEKKKNKTFVKASAVNEEAFECPICFVLPLPPKQVYQCTNGHIYCSDCKEKPRMSVCPQCRAPIPKDNAIRNLMYEEIIANVFT